MRSIFERRALPALLVACALLYVPRAGSYGLWDPWETHYGEIARQMAMRGDVITPWWPCSPDRSPRGVPQADPALLADGRLDAALRPRDGPRASVGAGRFVRASNGRSGFPTCSCRSPRSPSCGGRSTRLAGRRAAWLVALVLATSSQWILVTRQAMTDLPFVAPMTIALACAAVALLAPDEELAPTRRGRRLALAGLLVLTLPQLVLFSLQLRCAVRLGAHVWHAPGVVAMLPYLDRAPAHDLVVRARPHAPAASSPGRVGRLRAGDAGQGPGRAGDAGADHRALSSCCRAARARSSPGSSCRAASCSSRSSRSPGTTACTCATARRSGASSSATTTSTARRDAAAIAAPSSTTCRGSATARFPGPASPCSACYAGSASRAARWPRSRSSGPSSTSPPSRW